MRSGSKHLRIASVIQILLGVISIISTYFLIGEADIEATGISAEHALIILIATYCGAAFQVLAGIIGLLLSNKKSILTVLCGILLFIPQLITFLHVQDNIVMIIINIVFLAIPYFYLHNAYKNFKA